jgi:hypothetical protein
MTMTAHAARALGLLAALSWLVIPGSTRAAVEAPVDVELDVRVSTGGPDEAALQQAVEERVKARLAELGHSVRADVPTDLDVSVDWYDEAETIYGVVVVVRRNGELVNHATETCPRCGTTELFELLTARIDRAEEHLALLAVEVAATAQEPEPSGEAIPAPARRETRLTPLGWTGVAVAGVGVVVSAVGAGVWSKGKVIEPATGNDLWLVGKDYRPPGIALVATGAAVLVGGIAMLAVDVARARHRRVRMAGAFDGTAAMAVVTGRF